MNQSFALSLSDLRLLQTCHLLELSLGDHPDQRLVGETVGAIRACRDAIALLRCDLPGGNDDTGDKSRLCA